MYALPSSLQSYCTTTESACGAGMDKGVVEEAVQKEHGFTDGARATEFLEKIVQVQHSLHSSMARIQSAP